jgi:hypothetical protein
MTEPPHERTWDIEPWRPGDEAAILELFRRDFGRERSEAHWRWKFLENPYGGPFISLAWHREPRFLVGNQILMPFPLCVDGREVLGGHSLDLVVHRDFRRQGVFEHTGRHAEATLAAAGGRALIAFPNAQSYPGFVRSLEWKRILEPTRWTLRLSIRRELSRRLGPTDIVKALEAVFRQASAVHLGGPLREARAATVGLAVAHEDRLPAETDALWDRERARVDLSLWKDTRYLTWRYARHPEQRFRFHALRRGTELEGLLVSTVRDGVALLCELIVPSREVAAGRRLVREVVALHAGEGAESVDFLGHDGGFFAAAFAGFRRRAAAANVLVGRAIADESLTARMADAGRWTVSYGDGDFV